MGMSVGELSRFHDGRGGRTQITVGGSIPSAAGLCRSRASDRSGHPRDVNSGAKSLPP